MDIDNRVFLRVTDNNEQLALETLSNPNRLGLVSDLIIEPTTDKTLKISKSKWVVEGIYYHKDIMDNILQGKTELNFENEKLIEINELLKNEINNLKNNKWFSIKNIFKKK